MSSLSDKSSRRRYGVDPSDDGPIHIIPGLEGAALADSHASTVELVSPPRGSSLVVPNEDKTRISKRMPAEQQPPPIHVGPLESRGALEGETLDHFKLETYVGGGGMGAVYRAFDTRLNRIVAVKILSRDQSDPETVRRFRNEAQSAARLDDPHIARVYFVGEDKGWNFIVFEFIEGTNIRELVEKNGPLPLDETLDYTLQVAAALDHAAARDVVHRDIKPSNVLVTPEGAVKLVDMGLARLHQVESDADDLTQSGVTLGTFDYISPEQARDPRSADVRSDIYSLGCTLYFMLAGRAPFPDGTALQKLIRHNSDEPPDVRLFRPDAPDDVVAILHRALAKKPEHRFQTPVELIAAISRVSQRLNLGIGTSSSARLAVQWPSSAASAVPWWHRLLPLGVAALVLFALAVFPESWAGRSSSEFSKLPNVERPAVVTKPATTDEPIATPAEQPQRIDESPAKPTERPAEIEPTPVKAEQTAIAKTPGTSGPLSPDMEETTPKIQSPNETITKPVGLRTKVVVGAQAAADDAVVKATFAEALAYAAANPEVVVVELAFSGRKNVSTSATSFQIASQQLEIRAAPSFTPELVFQPSPDNMTEHRRMIRMVLPRSRLTLSGVRLRFEVPNSPADWSLIQFSSGSVLELKDSVASIVNTSPDSLRRSPQVSFFEPAKPVTLIDESGESLELPPPRILIQESVLRGDATVIRLSDNAPLTCQVIDSFVATGGRFLETPGTSAALLPSDRISLALERSTLATQAGLVLAGSRPDWLYRVPIAIDTQNCVIVTDAAAPVIEYNGQESAEVEPPLVAKGPNNYFARTNVFARRVTRHDGIDDARDASLANLPRWASELSALPATLVQPIPDADWHDQTPADYVLKSHPESGAGCTPALLPAVEGPTRRPIMGATNMGTMKSDSLMPIMDDKRPSP